MAVSMKDHLATPRVVVARTWDEAEALADLWSSVAWQRIEPDPFFYREAMAFKPNAQPHVVAVKRGSRLVGLAVGRLETTTLPLTFGYLRVADPRVRALTVVPGGLHGAEEPEDALLLIGGLRDTLHAGEADIVVLPAVAPGSPLHEAAVTKVPATCRQHVRRTSTRRGLDLPGSFDEFMQSLSKKLRSTVKQYERRLEREHGDAVEVECLAGTEDADRLYADVAAIAATTYQERAGVAFRGTREQRALTDHALARGCFRAWILRVAGAPVAFWQGYVYGGTFFTGTPGYDPAWGRVNVGTVLLVRLIEDLIADPQVGSIDFGPMEADWKRRFGNRASEEVDVTIFAPSLRGLLLNAGKTALDGSWLLAKAGLARSGLEPRVRRMWRRRLGGSAG